jgi:hypothetical protein
MAGGFPPNPGMANPMQNMQNSMIAPHQILPTQMQAQNQMPMPHMGQPLSPFSGGMTLPQTENTQGAGGMENASISRSMAPNILPPGINQPFMNPYLHSSSFANTNPVAGVGGMGGAGLSSLLGPYGRKGGI